MSCFAIGLWRSEQRACAACNSNCFACCCLSQSDVGVELELSVSLSLDRETGALLIAASKRASERVVIECNQ